MTLIEEKADEVAAELGDDFEGHGAFDWMMLIEMALQFLSACRKTPKDAVALAKRPKLFEKVKARFAVRQAARAGKLDLGDETVGDVVNALFAVGKRTTEAEFKKMLAVAAKG